MSDEKRPFRETAEPLLPAKVAPLGGWLLVAVGAATIGGGLYGAATGGEALLDAVALFVLSTLFGAGLLAAGLLLLAEKGGLALARSTDGGLALRFRGVGRSDALVVPATAVTALRLVPRDEVWGREPTRSWSCELLRAGSCPIVVAESSDYEAVWAVGRAVENRLGVPLREQGHWSPPQTRRDGVDATAEGTADGRTTVEVRRGGALARVLAALGVAGLVIGAVLMSQVEKEPVFGFLFGPTLFFLGLALAGAAAAGYVATDVIVWTSAAVERRARLGRLSWGRKVLPRAEPAYLRIHPRGLVGASLELVGQERTLVLVGGVTRSSRLGYAGLLDLAAELRQALGVPPVAEPVEPIAGSADARSGEERPPHDGDHPPSAGGAREDA